MTMLISLRILVSVGLLIGIGGVESSRHREPRNKKVFSVDGKLLTANYENNRPTSTVVRQTNQRKNYSKVNSSESSNSASCSRPGSKSTDEDLKNYREYRKLREHDSAKFFKSCPIEENLQSLRIEDVDYRTVIEPSVAGLDDEEVIARLRCRYGVFYAKNLKNGYNPDDDKILNLEEKDKEVVCQKVTEHVRLIERTPERRFLAYLHSRYLKGCPVVQAYGAEKVEKVRITWYPSISFNYVQLPTNLAGIRCRITELDVFDGEPNIDIGTIFTPNWLLITRGESDYSAYVFRAYPAQIADEPMVKPYAHLTFDSTLKPLLDKINDPADRRLADRYKQLLPKVMRMIKWEFRPKKNDRGKSIRENVRRKGSPEWTQRKSSTSDSASSG